MSSILQRVAPIGEARDREILKDAATYVYEERPEGDVLAHLFFPEKAEASPRPAIVFFHGGLWDSPTPTQFVPHCLHFASRGAVADNAYRRFIDAGYSEAQALDVVLGISLATLCNFANTLAGTAINPELQPYASGAI